MRRFAALLALLIATPAAATISSGGGPATYGLSSSIQSNYPWAGTLEITVDDSPRWVYTDLVDSLRRANADSGLTGTPWEMHASCFVNFVGLNGMNGFHGQDGTSGCTSGSDTCRISAAELRSVAGSGLIEVGSHGYVHGSLDWTVAVNGTSVWEVNGTQTLHPEGGVADSSMEQEIAGSYHALVDSTNIWPVYTFVCPNHRLSSYATYYLAKYYYNCRGGLLETGTTNWANDSTNNGGDSGDRGINAQHNPDFLDPIMYWASKYNEFGQFMRSPTYPGSRMWIPNCPDNTSNATTGVNDAKWMIAFAAEQKATVVWTWHRQNVSGQAPNPNLGGLDGVMSVLRFAAHYCRNGLLAREGPKLQVMTVNDGENKRLNVAHLAGPVNCIDNIMMLPDTTTCPATANGSRSRPYGIAPACSTLWAARGWNYIGPDSLSKAGGWFAMDAQDGANMTTRDSLRTGGIFASAKATSAKFDTLIVYTPVIPGSRVRVWCYGSTSLTDSAATTIASGQWHDSFSTDYIDVKITPLAFTFDPTDTVNTWANQATTISEGMMVHPHSESNWISSQPSGWTGISGESLTGITTLAYTKIRMANRFHMADSWLAVRNGGWSVAAPFGGATFQGDSTGGPANGTSRANTNASSQRWREFYGTQDIPLDCGWAQIAFCPVGFQVNAACSLAVTAIEAQCSPR